MLQFRPVGDAGWKETPFYSPARDIAYNGIPFITQALADLDKTLDSNPGFREWLKQQNVSDADIVGAAERLAKFFNKVEECENTDELIMGLPSYCDPDDIGMQVVYAAIGQFMVLATFTGMRDLSRVPSSVKEFKDMVEAVKQQFCKAHSKA